jgi:hypothetical protein
MRSPAWTSSCSAAVCRQIGEENGVVSVQMVDRALKTDDPGESLGTHAGIRLEDLVDAAGRVAGEILQFPEGSIQEDRHDARLKPDPEIRVPLFHRDSCTCQNRTGGAGRGVIR